MSDDENDPMVEQIGEALIDAIEAFAETCDRPLMTGEVMGALFGVLMTTAQSSPRWDREKFVAQITSRMRDAMGDD